MSFASMAPNTYSKAELWVGGIRVRTERLPMGGLSTGYVTHLSEDRSASVWVAMRAEITDSSPKYNPTKEGTIPELESLVVHSESISFCFGWKRSKKR